MTPTAATAPARIAEPARISGSVLLVGAFLVFWLAVLIAPLALLLVYSLFTTAGLETVYTASPETWQTLFTSGRWLVGIRTIGVAALVTAIALALAFPFAFWLAKGCRSNAIRVGVLIALTVPFFLEITSRTVVWRAILGNEGLINTLIGFAGMPTQTWLLYSPFAVHFGMVLLYFPSMFFPLYMALGLIDDQQIAAAEDLGASPLQCVRLVILPLAMPGIVAGVIFTLVPTMAEFVTPQLLGGSNVNLLGNSISAALAAIKYPMAAALSCFVIVVLVVLLALLLIVRGRGRAGLFAEVNQ